MHSLAEKWQGGIGVVSRQMDAPMGKKALSEERVVSAEGRFENASRTFSRERCFVKFA